ncbi:Glycosyltransferase [Zea mays]|uniref:Glycosyltransferase n=1 Tax=Zea mays TaxID=4577 RepID=A0A1D6N4E8_MAIZE|nr:Glycosyltransferase [Zea mays]
MKTRSSARGEPRRLGNAALLALMLCSVVALSLIRGRFAPIGDAIKSEDYPSDHPVLRDPMAIHKQGWNALKTTYLDKQNVRPHLGRLKNTFLQALKMLPHGRDD